MCAYEWSSRRAVASIICSQPLLHSKFLFSWQLKTLSFTHWVSERPFWKHRERCWLYPNRPHQRHAWGRWTCQRTSDSYVYIHAYTMYTEVASRKSTPKHCIFHLFICSALAFPASNFRAFSLSEAAAYIIQSYVRQKQILPIACTLYIIHCTKQV